MHAPSLAVLFGLGELAPLQRRALVLVYASSLMLLMGVNFILPVLPAMKGPLGVSDASVAVFLSTCVCFYLIVCLIQCLCESLSVSVSPCVCVLHCL